MKVPFLRLNEIVSCLGYSLASALWAFPCFAEGEMKEADEERPCPILGLLQLFAKGIW